MELVKSSDSILTLAGQPHRRWNPLLREWVLVSPHRTQRPWQGDVEKPPTGHAVTYDPECYLCPGNRRAGGHRNPDYTSTFVFDNDFAALLPGTPDVHYRQNELLIAESEAGICKVVCFSPRHDLTIANMSQAEVRGVVDVWAEQYRELAATGWVRHVEIFENRGAMMGASNPHPHCQIWANASIPNIPDREQQAFADFAQRHGRCMLCEYLQVEQGLAEREVFSNEHFIALVPFWAVWPFETIVISRAHVASLDQLGPAARDALAEVLRRVTAGYDNLFRVSFPYTMGFHQQPTDRQPHPEWHLHAHYLPPLLRSATVRKFMVGYELLASPQRDITPESAAERLRNCVEAAPPQGTV
jgi:UDPglucose--hexose-1-phosphate uridylyltransferase